MCLDFRSTVIGATFNFCQSSTSIVLRLCYGAFVSINLICVGVQRLPPAGVPREYKRTREILKSTCVKEKKNYIKI